MHRASPHIDCFCFETCRPTTLDNTFMALNLTLARKYAEHKQSSGNLWTHNSQVGGSKRDGSPQRSELRSEFHQNYMYSTPQRRFYESNRLLARRSTSKMPGTFRSPIKSLRSFGRNTGTAGKYPTFDLNDPRKPRKYRITKEPVKTQNKNHKGVLHGLWQFAKTLGARTQDTRLQGSLATTLAPSSHDRGNSYVDIESLLELKGTRRTVQDVDLVEDSIKQAKEQQKTKTQAESVKALIAELQDEKKKALELKASFEKQALQMKLDFRNELDKATEAIRDLTTKTAKKYGTMTDNDLKTIESKLFKENEVFLTSKHETESKHRAILREIEEKQAELDRRERKLEHSQESSENSFRLLQITLETIKKESSQNASVLTKEFEFVAASRRLNTEYGKNLLNLIEATESSSQLKPLRILACLLSEDSPITKSYDVSSRKMAEFITETYDKVQRCQEFLADCDLNLLQNTFGTCRFFDFDQKTLNRIETCFSGIQKINHQKSQKLKDHVKENFKLLSKLELIISTPENLAESLCAFVRNIHLFVTQSQLLNLQKDINNLLRSLKILEVKSGYKKEVNLFET
ncbi:hypothetical protein PUMCH_000371 [Australozyma saopauloensis]|uniref:Uncharacterized protein n=1 Tax=Australozyma saopauloensis TaxID=291208 RepID=A0AAX4H3N0_9ASCO|nr:hypothetical protein PUMCH_000371 [[Candida] saopauloensis]